MAGADEEWDAVYDETAPVRRPAWVRWVAVVAALALLLPLAVSAVRLLT